MEQDLGDVLMNNERVAVREVRDEWCVVKCARTGRLCVMTLKDVRLVDADRTRWGLVFSWSKYEEEYQRQFGHAPTLLVQGKVLKFEIEPNRFVWGYKEQGLYFLKTDSIPLMCATQTTSVPDDEEKYQAEDDEWAATHIQPEAEREPVVVTVITRAQQLQEERQEALMEELLSKAQVTKGRAKTFARKKHQLRPPLSRSLEHAQPASQESKEHAHSFFFPRFLKVL